MDDLFHRLALDYDAWSALGSYSVSERNRQLETGSYVEADKVPEVESLMDAPVESSTHVERIRTKPFSKPNAGHDATELLESITGPRSTHDCA